MQNLSNRSETSEDNFFNQSFDDKSTPFLDDNERRSVSLNGVAFSSGDEEDPSYFGDIRELRLARNSTSTVASTSHFRPSLRDELCKITSSVTPNDFIVSLQFFLAAYYIAGLAEYAENDDGSTIALITVVSHTCIRIMFSGFQLPASFAHIGIRFDEDTNKIETDPLKFTASMAAMIKAGLLTSIPGIVLLCLTPLLYQATGSSTEVITASYDYILLACASLPFQNCNVGFQQTLLKLGKKNRMLQAAAMNALFTCLPILGLVVFGNPIKELKSIQALALIFVLGSALMTLFYSIYFHAKNSLPGWSTYFNPQQSKDISTVFMTFMSIGFNIFLQLFSELGAVYVQPFTARLFLPKKDLGAILSVLNCTSNINLFAIVPGITGSQATSNAVDTSVRLIRNGSQDPAYCDDIRHAIILSFISMLIFSAIINIGLLTAVAPTVTELFYNSKNLDISGPSKNMYLIIALTGIGTTIDYIRNLALFVLRAFEVNTYGTATSYLSLWIVNIVLVAALSQIKDIGALGELVPYYTAILFGSVLLWRRVFECVNDNKKLIAIIKQEDPQHAEKLLEVQRIFPKWLCLHNSSEDKAEQRQAAEETVSFLYQ